jgi:hypothetical protein
MAPCSAMMADTSLAACAAASFSVATFRFVTYLQKSPQRTQVKIYHRPKHPKPSRLMKSTHVLWCLVWWISMICPEIMGSSSP